MKRSLPIMLLMFVLAISCKKDKDNNEDVVGRMVFSADSLVFKNDQTKSLYLYCEPNSNYSYAITSYPEWISVNYNSGAYYTSGISEINLRSNLGNSKPGIYTGYLEIFSTLGKKSILLKGIVGEYFEHGIPDSLIFSIIQHNKQLYIRNYGNTELNYQLSASNDYISLAKSSGVVAPNESDSITVTVNRTGMVTGTYYSKISANINGKVKDIDVSITNLIEKKIMLQTDVTDAEYNKVMNNILYTSSNPPALNIYNCFSGTTSKILLDFAPNCVSIAPDGKTAVIGHDGHLSHINLETRTLIRIYSISCNSSDIVLAQNKWAYVFPKSGQSDRVRCVNLDIPSDNETVSQSTLYGSTSARLHPSGKYIYGSNSYDIEKYNIQNGTLSKMYDGDHNSNGNLWLSEDGQRIFTQSKKVLKTSEVQSLDMMYNGTINSNTYTQIMWLDHSSIKNNLYIILSGNDYNSITQPFIFVHNAYNLTYKYKIELEKFVIVSDSGETKLYNAVPFYVFSHSTGNKIYTIVKAHGAGLVNEWALQVDDIE